MPLAPKNRPINEKEHRYLKSKAADILRRRARMWQNLYWAYGFAALLSALTILADWNKPIYRPLPDAIIAVSFWTIFTTVTGFPAFVQQRRRRATRASQYDQVLQRGTCSDLRIQSKRMWEFEELGDEGLCFAFELDSGGVVFVAGQELYAGPRFPNQDFSLVEFHTADGQLLDFIVEKRGAKLVPERVITAKEKENLHLPEHASFLEGTLEDVYAKLNSA
jgi:hypothetical protein